MKSRCAGFVHSRYEQGWELCALPPARGDKFCAVHREGFDAAMLSVAAESITADAQERKIEAGLRAHRRAVRKAARRKIILAEDSAAAPRPKRADVYGERSFAAARARSFSSDGGQSAAAKTTEAPPPRATGRSHAQIRPG